MRKEVWLSVGIFVIGLVLVGLIAVGENEEDLVLLANMGLEKNCEAWEQRVEYDYLRCAEKFVCNSDGTWGEDIPEGIVGFMNPDPDGSGGGEQLFYSEMGLNGNQICSETTGETCGKVMEFGAAGWRESANYNCYGYIPSDGNVAVSCGASSVAGGEIDEGIIGGGGFLNDMFGWFGNTLGITGRVTSSHVCSGNCFECEDVVEVVEDVCCKCFVYITPDRVEEDAEEQCQIWLDSSEQSDCDLKEMLPLFNYMDVADPDESEYRCGPEYSEARYNFEGHSCAENFESIFRLCTQTPCGLVETTVQGCETFGDLEEAMIAFKSYTGPNSIILTANQWVSFTGPERCKLDSKIIMKKIRDCYTIQYPTCEHYRDMPFCYMPSSVASCSDEPGKIEYYKCCCPDEPYEGNRGKPKNVGEGGSCGKSCAMQRDGSVYTTSDVYCNQHRSRCSISPMGAINDPFCDGNDLSYSQEFCLDGEACVPHYRECKEIVEGDCFDKSPGDWCGRLFSGGRCEFSRIPGVPGESHLICVNA